MLRSKLIKFSLLLLGISLLNSCGFHLRGSMSVPKEIQTLSLQSDSSSEQFTQVLRESLRNYKINVVSNPKQARIILHIISATLNQSDSALNDTSQLRQYTLSFVIKYELLSQSGQVIVATQSVTSSTTFKTNMNNMITDSNSLTAQYLPSLQRDAIFHVMEHLLADNSRAALTQYLQKPNST